jgi:hypothetical protein
MAFLLFFCCLFGYLNRQLGNLNGVSRNFKIHVGVTARKCENPHKYPCDGA